LIKKKINREDIERQLHQGNLSPIEYVKIKKQLAEEEKDSKGKKKLEPIEDRQATEETIEEKEGKQDKEGKEKPKDGPGKEALKRCVHVCTAKPKDGKNREWEVTSIEESKAYDEVRETLKTITKSMLVRIYPHGTRFDSSNYNPVPLLAEGCQIVALNYHTDGFPMWLNEGKFMRAGRTGWILKPQHLQVQQDQKDEIKTKTLEITVISGWRLPRPWGTKTISSTPSPKLSKPKVEVSHWTPENIDNKELKETKNFEVPPSFSQQNKYVYYTKHSDNPHNPIFYDKSSGSAKGKLEKEMTNKKRDVIDKRVHVDPQPFSFQIQEPELEMIVFKVFDNNEDENILGFKMNQDANKIIGYFAITVADMRKGIRVVPLKGEFGAPLIAGDLLVKIEEKDE